MFQSLFVLVIFFQFSDSYYFDVQSGKPPVTSLLSHKSNRILLNTSNEEKTSKNYIKITSRRQVKNAAPKFTNESLGLETFIKKSSGDAVILECDAKGTPTPNITWYKNNDPVKRTSFPVTYDKWRLLMNELASDDTGQYGCRICNAFGCIQRNFELLVSGPSLSLPRIKHGYPGKQTVKIHESVEMACPLMTATEHTIDWLRESKYAILTSTIKHNSVSIPMGRQDFVLHNMDKYVISDNKLTIKNVTNDDEGWYTCITSNSLGQNTSTGYLELTVVNDSADVHWLIPTLAALLVVSIVIVLLVFLKIKRDRVMKQRAREVMSEHWMKIVTIEKAMSNGYIADCVLQMPVVRIEKQKVTKVKKNYTQPIHASEYVLPIDTDWEVSRQHLTFAKVLGEGEFGKVVQAECVRLPNSNKPCTVAVKMLKDGHSDADMIAFVSEMEIMKTIGKHKNIINLLGCSTRDGPPYIIVEYAQNGSLREFLRKHRSDKSGSPEGLIIKQLTQRELVEFALQVAKGMEYLASRGCIHRDLAARNVLVSGDCVLKVADFGLARDVRDTDYYRKHSAGKLPIKWMSPESLCHNYYNKKSDVWSFGVLTWEIMTLGNPPYPHVPAHYLYHYLKLGKRMEKPENCGQDIYDLIKHCCSFSPDDRPTFSEVREKLQAVYIKI